MIFFDILAGRKEFIWSTILELERPVRYSAIASKWTSEKSRGNSAFERGR